MRIGIVHDQTAVVDALTGLLARNHRVIWTAGNGLEAVELCRGQRPDLVLVNLLMAGMDGVETTRLIMASAPCAILIVTDSVEANTARVFEAMGHGALDAVEMPAPGGNLQEATAPLLAKITTISHLVGETRVAAAANGMVDRRRPRARHDRLVAIGASAGGPAALATVLRGLPGGFRAAIVIVQHVDAQFTAGMTEWLSCRSSLPVSVAREGDRLIPGRVLMAGTSDHLVLTPPDRLGYTPAPIHDIYRPSIDVFFQSISRGWRGEVVGVLLTGMGRDGALGLRALRNQGHYTIAQDEATSAVYGMPKAAAALNAAVDVLPIARIAARLTEVFGASDRTLVRG